jgi:hypothetical protein
MYWSPISTSLILDGSPASLDASLRLIQFYAEISGLETDLEKTNVIWIGSKKHSQDKICVKWGLKWDPESVRYHQRTETIYILCLQLLYPLFLYPSSLKCLKFRHIVKRCRETKGPLV